MRNHLKMVQPTADQVLHINLKPIIFVQKLRALQHVVRTIISRPAGHAPDVQQVCTVVFAEGK